VLFVFGLTLAVLVLFGTSASSASAEVVVKLAGGGSGTVTSNPPGIECSNSGGDSSGPSCRASYGLELVELTAAPDSGFEFSGWSGNDPFGGGFGPTCNEGTANPCVTVDPALFGNPPTTITAIFGCPPPVAAPLATTGEVSADGDPSLRVFEGAIDPEGCGIEESYFEYGPSTEYGSTTATIPSAAGIGRGSEPVAVGAETEPLTPNTTYHYRLVAVSPGGTSKGEDRTFTTGPAPTDTCSNAARRAEQGIIALHLPGCMALEMVSPPRKAGSAAKFPNVSADGSRISFLSLAALGENPPALAGVGGATYVASRGDSGWTSQMIVPDVSPDFARQWEVTSAIRPSFTPDFSRWFGIGSTVEQWQHGGISQAYEAGLGGFFRPLSGPLVPLSGELLNVLTGSQFQGASADHSHFYFRPGAGATYLPGDPNPAFTVEPGNVYLARGGPGGGLALELLQRDRSGKVWGGACGARLGGIGSAASPGLSAPNGERNQGAVSFDGSRTYFSARASQPPSGNCDETANKLRILERLETPAGPQIFPLFTSECSRTSLPNPPGPCKELSGDDLYQGASLDGSKVYFTTNRQLASSDVDGSSAEECSVLSAVAGCDLYLYDRDKPAGARLVQVSAGEEVPGKHQVGEEADVYNGITAISADGSHVYFVATGVLTDHLNPQGDSAQLGEPNLYMWDSESEKTTFVGTLARALSLEDKGDAIIFDNGGSGLWGGQGTWRNNAYPVPVTGTDDEGKEVGGDGHILVFESRAELTASDADGRRLDVYRYDAAIPSLECLSCAQGSSAFEPDSAPLDVKDHGEINPLGTDFAESHRWVSEDGKEVGFITPEALAPGDPNGSEDFYLWRQDTLVRLPGKPFLGFGTLVSFAGPFLSHDGSTVAFTTGTPLLPQDGDSAADVYVAREAGGFPNPHASQCELGVNCQEGEKEPGQPAPATNSFTGPGNPKPHSCPKRKVHRHGRCVAKHAGKRHVKRRHRIRQPNTDRRVSR
jgi:hypothetical protein